MCHSCSFCEPSSLKISIREDEAVLRLLYGDTASLGQMKSVVVEICEAPLTEYQQRIRDRCEIQPMRGVARYVCHR